MTSTPPALPPLRAAPYLLPPGGSLVDVAGLRVGHAERAERATGCTVVLCGADGAVCGVDVRGAAPGTRETDLLAPVNTVDRVHAVLLSGGSAHGLEAASGVMRWLEARGRGLRVGPACVPIVPAAVLFDLWQGDVSVRPDASTGLAACEAANGHPPLEGAIGAGAGATLGKLCGPERSMQGGIGSASITVGGVTVAALVAVNAIGDVLDPASGRLVAGLRHADARTLRDSVAALCAGEHGPAPLDHGGATTIGIVATDVRLDKAQATKLAQMAHDGLARSIRPAHTPHDGDTLFALATGRSAAPADLLLLGALAAEVATRAILRGVIAAHARTGRPAWQDLDAPILPGALAAAVGR